MSQPQTRPVAVALTISDTSWRGEREDISGPALAAALTSWGADVRVSEILPDDRAMIAEKLRDLADHGDIQLIVTTGGTGFAPRDSTPEATRDVIDREAPGLAELMRLRSLEKTPLACLSRAVCGIRGQTVIVNLPGSPKGVAECFEAIGEPLKHAVRLLSGEQVRCSG